MLIKLFFNEFEPLDANKKDFIMGKVPPTKTTLKTALISSHTILIDGFELKDEMISYVEGPDEGKYIVLDLTSVDQGTHMLREDYPIEIDEEGAAEVKCNHNSQKPVSFVFYVLVPLREQDFIKEGTAPFMLNGKPVYVRETPIQR
jgi:hypothetical protein